MKKFIQLLTLSFVNILCNVLPDKFEEMSLSAGDISWLCSKGDFFFPESGPLLVCSALVCLETSLVFQICGHRICAGNLFSQ